MNTTIIVQYLSGIYPLAAVIILIAGVKIYKADFSPESWSRKQSKNLQGIACIMIIIHHMVQTMTNYGQTDQGPISCFNSLGILFTSIFFFFSGFGLYTSYQKKENYTKRFLDNRLPQILIPFLVTNLLYIFALGLGDRITTLFHVPTSILGLTLINTNAWFLVEIMILYLAFYFVFTRIKNERTAFIMLTIFVISMILVSLLLCHDKSQVNGHWFMGEWWYNTTFLFIIGMFFAKNEDRIKKFFQKYYRIILPVTIVLFCLAYLLEEFVVTYIGYYQEWKGYYGYGEKFLTLTTQILLCFIFVVLLLLLNMKCSFNNFILRFLGGISLELYLIHDLFRQTSYNEEMPGVEFFGLVLVSSILAAWLLGVIHKYLINFWHDYRHYMSGEELTYEASSRIQKWGNLVKYAKYFYLLTALSLVLFGLLRIYDSKIRLDQEYRTELKALQNSDIGDIVYLGYYEMDSKYPEPERIPWVVTDIQDGHLLLVSDKILANSYYNQQHVPVHWIQSDLCKNLNYDFYENVFSTKEKKLLCGRYDSATNSWCHGEKEAFSYSSSGITVNRELVFLLTRKEVLFYYPTAKDRIASASQTAQDCGLGVHGTDYIGAWWLEDSGTQELRAMFISSWGEIETGGKIINNSGMGVRPAIWVDASPDSQ